MSAHLGEDYVPLKKDGWQPIDTAPMETWVFVLDQYFDATVAYMSQDTGRWHGTDLLHDIPLECSLVCWMSLPPPPERIP